MTDFKTGDRVRWTGKRRFPHDAKRTHAASNPDKVGKTGTVTRDVFPSAMNGDWAVNIRFDDGNDSVCFVDNLELVQETNIVANIKTLAKTALDALLAPLNNESAKEQAVRRLGIAAALATRADSEKKAAKAKLKELGVIREDYDASTTETVFDSERYTVEAVTNAGSQRLDLPSLEAALAAEKLSSAMRQRILNGALKDVKPATSFKVESK